MVSSLFIWVFGVMGFEEGGRDLSRQKSVRWTFFSPGENPIPKGKA